MKSAKGSMRRSAALLSAPVADALEGVLIGSAWK